MKYWYAVHCGLLQDARTGLHLRNRSYEIFRSLVRRCGMRLRQVMQSMFPGCLFVRLDDEFQSRAPIRSTCDVAGERGQ